MLAGIFESVARFIGELAEIHFPRMARNAEHEDVCAGTENTILEAGHHHGADFRMFKTDAADGVVQFDVNTEVIAVEL